MEGKGAGEAGECRLQKRSVVGCTGDELPEPQDKPRGVPSS